MTQPRRRHRGRLLALLKDRYDLEELRTLCFILAPDLPGLAFDNLPGETLEGKARELIRFAEHRDAWTILLQVIQQQREDLTPCIAPLYRPEQFPCEATTPLLQVGQRHFFICYKRHGGPDRELAVYLHDFLTAQGHSVFIDVSMRSGKEWLKEIDHQIKASDFLVVLLSQESADSEMVQAEVRRAYLYRKQQGKPQTLPVRIAYEGLLPYSIDAFLDPLQYVLWEDEADSESVGHEILAAIEGRLPERTAIEIQPVAGDLFLSEDGRVVSDEEALYPPLPVFDPRFLEELDAPGGAVRLRDRYADSGPHPRRFADAVAHAAAGLPRGQRRISHDEPGHAVLGVVPGPGAGPAFRGAGAGYQRDDGAQSHAGAGPVRRRIPRLCFRAGGGRAAGGPLYLAGAGRGAA